MMQRMACKEVKLHEALQALYNSQSPSSPVRKYLDDMKAVLGENMFAGERIPKEKIPPYYVNGLGVRNLYHYTHPGYFRSTYTIINEGRAPFCVIYDYMSHHDYNKRFGYD